MRIPCRVLCLTLIMLMPFLGHATAFDIEAMRIGPNPIVQGKDAMIVNYTASKKHRSTYYLYAASGRLLQKKTFQSNQPFITHSGECKFELFDRQTMARINKQLVIIIAIFESEDAVIQKRKYVIVK